MGNTHEAEQVVSCRISEKLIYGVIALKAMGYFPKEPVRLMTDNAANQTVLEKQNASSSSRYFLIRQHCLHKRIEKGEIDPVYVPDKEMPADAMSKWTTAEKAKQSFDYITGYAHVNEKF